MAVKNGWILFSHSFRNQWVIKVLENLGSSKAHDSVHYFHQCFEVYTIKNFIGGREFGRIDGINLADYKKYYI